MATSDRTRHVREHSTADSRFSRYDLLLLVIPTAFLLAFVGSTMTSLPVSTLMAAASMVGALAVADGLFRNPPNHGPGH